MKSENETKMSVPTMKGRRLNDERIFRQDIRRILEMRIDDLAHILNIHGKTSRIIQNILNEEIKKR